MRTIKFRGRSKQTGKWLYGDLLWIGKDVFIVPYDGDWFDFTSFDNAFRLPPDEYAVIPETIGQFTGLKDKNGKEIYERDILRVISLNTDTLGESKIVQVMYDKYYAAFTVYIGEGRSWSLGSTGYECEIEVIGNVHDNPELLKG